jgi:5-methylcytosine-specific restriction protein A
MNIQSIKRPGQKPYNQGKTYTDTSFYRSKPWRDLRAFKLRQDPNCVVCGKPGQMVDHRERIEAGGAKLDLANLQTMCNHCHNVKRAVEKNAKYAKK